MGFFPSNKKISAVVILFPAAVLFICAAISYAIYSYSQQKSADIFCDYYQSTTASTLTKMLQSNATLINDSINTVGGDNKKVSKFINSIKKQGFKNIVIANSDNTPVYSIGIKSLNKGQFDALKKSKDGFYKNRDLVLFAKSDNVLHYKIVNFFYKNSSCDERLKNNLYSIYTSSIQKNLLWFIAIWLILFALSLLFSKIIYNRLKSYEQQIKSDKKRIIFQSRQALLGELLPMIAHQWRQPLNKIAAVIMRMRFEISGGKPKPETLDIQCRSIEDSVELMSQTIDDFRSFYRPKEEPVEVDLALIVRKAIYFLDELLERKKIYIHIDLMPVNAKLHSNEFLQVIINIIKNASDAVNAQGNIYITLQSLTKGFAQLRIEDDGTGIPKDKLEKIFEPHESSKQGSMGLGLYMGKLIIEQHFGGELKAYNTPKGAGFLIVIPTNGSKR